MDRKERLRCILQEKGCQEIFNINNRWKYLQTSKIWRLQKATISSGQQLCAGFSEKKILQVTNNEFKYRVHNAKFTNKATPKPVTAKHVQSQHQIDLIDLSKDPIKHNGKVYKYVLSVIDIFSRFLWLVPLEVSQAATLFECYNQFMTNMVHQIVFRATAPQNLKENYASCAKTMRSK